MTDQTIINSEAAPETPLVRPRLRILEVRDIAIALARNTGWRVFPCAENKLPAISKQKGGNGFHDASADPDTIARLWRRGPGDLIGVRTGAASGIDVLDVDRKHPTALA